MVPYVGIATLLCLSVALAANYDLTILHTNDVHSRIDEAHKYGGVCSKSDAEKGNCVGGFARMQTKVKEVRAGGGNILFLDGGDQFQGTFWFHVYKGLAAAQFMRAIGYDAMALGNHEFDNGLEPLQEFINNVTANGGFNVLSANINNANEPRLTGYEKYIVRELGGRKIGIVGYTTIDTPQLTAVGNVGNLKFEDIISSIKSAIAEMKSAHSDVDIIIAVGHAGFDVDKMVGVEVPEVQIVVGGHSNTFLWTGEKPSVEKPMGEYPHVVTKSNGKKALCVQAYTFTKYLGNLSVTFNDANEILSWNGNPILLDNSVMKDREIEAMLAPYRVVIEEQGNQPIARTSVRLDADCRQTECNMGNLVTDAWVHSNIVFGTDIKWSRAAIAIVNGGSIRANIERGNITFAQILTTMPFGNDVAAITISGTTLKKVFENSIRAYDGTGGTGRFLQVAGAQVTYDLSKPDGSRVVELRLRCLNCDIPTYEPLELTNKYTILCTTFMANGGDGYSMLANERLAFENLGFSESEMVMDYMSTLSTVYPGEEGRVKVIGTATEQIASSAVIITYTFCTIALAIFANWV